MLIRKFAVASAIAIGLLLLANVAVAVAPSIREAIKDLPVADQITFIANRVERNEKDQKCQKAERLYEVPDNWGNCSATLPEQIECVNRFILISEKGVGGYPTIPNPAMNNGQRLNFLMERLAEYNLAKSECEAD